MTIPVNAIDAEAGYQEWVRQYLWHVDQLPLLLETMALVAQPTTGVSRGGSRFDRPQITGANWHDNVPIQDGGATVDIDALWAATRAYVAAVSDHTGECPAPGVDGPLWSGQRRISKASVTTARLIGYTANAWLADRVERIVDWHDLSAPEDNLFRLIRRSRGRYQSAGTARRARPRQCVICGEAAVVVDWVDGANGSPKPVQVGRCRTCGQTYLGEETTE